MPDDEFDRRWSAADIERRARRILCQRLVESSRLTDFPTHERTWLEYIPSDTSSKTVVSRRVIGNPNWVESRIRSGWPPKTISNRKKRRNTDTILVTTLRWLAETIAGIFRDVEKLSPRLIDEVETRVSTLESVLQYEPLASATAEPPSRRDLRDIAKEGRIWRAAADVAEHLIAFDQADPETLAYEFLLPDEELRGRLFHLAVLGEMVCTTASFTGMEVVSTKPLGATKSEPAYRVFRGQNQWDVWFEAGGVWDTMDWLSGTYRQLTAESSRRAGALAPDVVVVESTGSTVLSVELKYSSNTDYVIRDGFSQALTYANEFAENSSGSVVSVVVGPEETLENTTFRRTDDFLIGLTTPSELSEVLSLFYEERVTDLLP